MATPRPKLDLFNDSPCLVSKKCRTSTPSLKPPKPPTKSSKQVRARNRSTHNYSFTTTNYHHNYNNHHPQYTNGASLNNSFCYGVDQQQQQQQHQQQQQQQQQQNIEIVSKIGSGYFADVYKAKSNRDGLFYALKKTLIPYTSNSDRSRKLQEVKNHKSLPPHPNCVRYHDSWEEDGFLYIQMELCESSLNQLLESRCEDKKLPEHLVWNLLADLLSAVKHLHDHDLLHLDIKPDNIFIAFDGTAKLGDFGLMCHCSDLIPNTATAAAAANNNSHSELALSMEQEHNEQQPEEEADDESATNTSTSDTTQQQLLNTTKMSLSDDFEDSFVIHQPCNHDDSGIAPGNRSDDFIDSIDEGDSKYLASETMQGKFTKAADIFSLGITIFEVASGLDLPQGGEIYHKLRHNEIEDLYFNGLSAELVRIIKMMMEEDYAKRPNAHQLLQLVTAIQQQQRPPLQPQNSWPTDKP